MDEAIEDLIESGGRLHVYTAWLKRFIEGHVNGTPTPRRSSWKPRPANAFTCAAAIPVY
jgi:hypothetical protein